MALPGHIWRTSGQATVTFSEWLPRRPGKWKMRAIRAGILATAIVMAPWLVLAQLFWRPKPKPALLLHKRVYEMWQTDPWAALGLLRATYERIKAAGVGMFTPFKSVDVSPFGKFRWDDALHVEDLLYKCEVALGRYEEALAIATAAVQTDDMILKRVDCLVAMKRRTEAIALLEANLDNDTWVGKFRRRLEELTGPQPN